MVTEYTNIDKNINSTLKDKKKAPMIGQLPFNFAYLAAVPNTLKAGNGTRTRDPYLGKVLLYQLSYSRSLR